MRYSLEDYHRQVCRSHYPVSSSSSQCPQDVAASCIFLATKTEECGRKLRDVAKVFQAKVTGVDITQIPDDSAVCDEVIYLTLPDTEHAPGYRKLPGCDFAY